MIWGKLAHAAAALFFALGLVIVPGHAPAQSLFGAVAEVGDRVVTGYELQQRIVMLEALGTAGDIAETALQQLVDERLQDIAALRDGIEISERQIDDEIEAFAARGELTGAELITQLGQSGVPPESFREFIRVGLAWRTLVRQRFSARSVPTGSEVERELSLTGRRGGLEFQFSEIFLPTNTPDNASITAQLVPQILALTRTEPFEDAARRFSVGQTRDQGGRVARWVSVFDLPLALNEALSAAGPGQVVGPVEFDGAVGLFQLRAKREAALSTRGREAIDYATYQVRADGRKSARDNAQEVLDRTDSCNDLYGIARGQPEDRLQRQTVPASQIPRETATLLDRLDADEASILTGGADPQSVTVVMLCARLPAGSAENTKELRAQAERDVLNRKLNAFATGYLQQLRGETRITIK